jgi:hypothetical protein
MMLGDMNNCMRSIIELNSGKYHLSSPALEQNLKKVEKERNEANISVNVKVKGRLKPKVKEIDTM